MEEDVPSTEIPGFFPLPLSELKIPECFVFAGVHDRFHHTDNDEDDEMKVSLENCCWDDLPINHPFFKIYMDSPVKFTVTICPDEENQSYVDTADPNYDLFVERATKIDWDTPESRKHILKCVQSGKFAIYGGKNRLIVCSIFINNILKKNGEF